MANGKKPWYQSKAKCGSILMALGAIGGYLTGTMDMMQTFTSVMSALGIFGIRDAL